MPQLQHGSIAGREFDVQPHGEERSAAAHRGEMRGGVLAEATPRDATALRQWRPCCNQPAIKREARYVFVLRAGHGDKRGVGADIEYTRGGGGGTSSRRGGRASSEHTLVRAAGASPMDDRHPARHVRYHVFDRHKI